MPQILFLSVTEDKCYFIEIIIVGCSSFSCLSTFLMLLSDITAHVTFLPNVHCPFLERNSIPNTDTWKGILGSHNFGPCPLQTSLSTSPPHSSPTLLSSNTSHLRALSCLWPLACADTSTLICSPSSHTLTLNLSFCSLSRAKYKC